MSFPFPFTARFGRVLSLFAVLLVLASGCKTTHTQVLMPEYQTTVQDVTLAKDELGDPLVAASLVGNEESARIVLLSDGAFEKVQDFSGGKASLLYQQIGNSLQQIDDVLNRRVF